MKIELLLYYILIIFTALMEMRGIIIMMCVWVLVCIYNNIIIVIIMLLFYRPDLASQFIVCHTRARPFWKKSNVCIIIIYVIIDIVHKSINIIMDVYISIIIGTNQYACLTFIRVL